MTDTVIDASDLFRRRRITPVPDRAAMRSRILTEGEWSRRIDAEFRARWQARYRQLIASAWKCHVREWAKEHPLCGPDSVPWSALWTTFLIACPEARRTEPEGAA